MPLATQPFTDTQGDHLSVRMFGAHMDGVTDDTDALLAAIDASRPGQHILIPGNGSMKISPDEVVINKPGVWLGGLGGHKNALSTLSASSGARIICAGGVAVRIINGATVYSGGDCRIENLIFTDPDGDPATVMVDAVGYLGGVQIVNCTLEAPRDVRQGIGFRGASIDNSHLVRCRIFGFNHGIEWNSSSTPIEDGGSAVATPCTSVGIDDCLVQENNVGLYIPYGPFLGLGNGYVKGGAFQGNYQYNIQSRSQNLVLHGVHVESVRAVTGRPGHGVYVQSGSLATFGCDMYHAPQVESFSGGGATHWTTALNMIGAPIVYLGGGLQTVGLHGTDSGKDFYWKGYGFADLYSDAGVSGTIDVTYPDPDCLCVKVEFGTDKYISVSDWVQGAIDSQNGAAMPVIMHPRYTGLDFWLPQGNAVVHDSQGISGPASKYRNYTVETAALDVRGPDGSDSGIDIAKLGATSASNIRYRLSHRGDDPTQLWLYSRDSDDDGTANFKNWLRCLYSDGILEFPQTVRAAAGNLLVEGAANTFVELVLKKLGAASTSNIQWDLSHRDNNQDLYLFSHDGTTFQNWIKCLFSSSPKEVQLPTQVKMLSDLVLTNLGGAPMLGTDGGGKIQAVFSVAASAISGILSAAHGGTGVGSLSDLASALTSYLDALYYRQSSVYTKAEVDALISAESVAFDTAIAATNANVSNLSNDKANHGHYAVSSGAVDI